MSGNVRSNLCVFFVCVFLFLLFTLKTSLNVEVVSLEYNHSQRNITSILLCHCRLCSLCPSNQTFWEQNTSYVLVPGKLKSGRVHQCQFLSSSIHISRLHWRGKREFRNTAVIQNSKTNVEFLIQLHLVESTWWQLCQFRKRTSPLLDHFNELCSELQLL